MLKIVCIGAGRLAHQLMPELERAGCEVIEVYNRTPDAGQYLVRSLKAATYQGDISKITTGGDIYFFAISDDGIGPLAKQVSDLANDHSIFVHCSGILSLNVLPFKRRGIFYPLQTFSATHTVDWLNTPILITTDNDDVLNQLNSLAHQISDKVYDVPGRDKAIIHLAAVFANNFSNHMLTLAEEICLDHHLSFEILKPLIRETFEKALTAGPSQSQTGPAIRGDEKTIKKHLTLLADQMELKALYQAITKSIKEHRKPE
ncbi:MAG TPA: Rossmann-like and DUF2520 domain-containing protein [Saprospiraceae bacterium]|nr:Rossmann-like and DUF2520 domain-containing protein [Saprospiraceae bacterium]